MSLLYECSSWNSKICVLFKFNANRLLLNQVLIVWKVTLMFSFKSVLSEPVIKILVLSAKRIVFVFLFNIFGKSFIYIKKSNGPRTESPGVLHFQLVSSLRLYYYHHNFPILLFEIFPLGKIRLRHRTFLLFHSI